MSDQPDREDLLARKAELRAVALARRRNLDAKESRSRLIWDHLRQLPAFAQAQTICSYVALAEEVQTWSGLEEILGCGKRLVVPFCVENELHLCHIVSLEELRPGRWGIWEPDVNIRALPDRLVLPEELDLVIVPGVAFDRTGGRLGWGKGYYDRLLARVPERCLSIGLAFSCQLFDRLPQLEHDVRVKAVATEEGIYFCQEGISR